MAFNIAQYNVVSFNTDGDKTRKVRVSMSETVVSSVGTASILSLFVKNNEKVRSSSRVEPARKIPVLNMTEQIEELVTDVLSSVVAKPVINESIDGNFEVFANILVMDFKEKIHEEINAKSDIVADIILPVEVVEGDDRYYVIDPTEIETDGEINYVGDLTEEVKFDTKKSHAGAYINLLVLGMNEIVGAVSSFDVLTVKTCYLGGANGYDLVLKPGQRLIIDASNYNVLLDGKNAIWYQSGDWIDELDRDTTSIEIRAEKNQGLIHATILYTERYL